MMTIQQADSTNIKDYAAIYVYEQKNTHSARYNRLNPFELHSLSKGYGYPILLDDSLIVKMGINWKKSEIITRKYGNHKLTAKVKQGNYTIPINIKRGEDYYIRLKYSISGRRIFEIVDNELGEFEYSIAD